jgi:hypothetical protein
VVVVVVARYVKMGPDVSCLIFKDNFFLGAVVTSNDKNEPWAFDMDQHGKKVLELRAGEHQGQKCLSGGGVPGGCKPGDKVDIGYPAIHRLLESDGLQEVTYPLVTTRLTWPKVARGSGAFVCFLDVYRTAQ